MIRRALSPSLEGRGKGGIFAPSTASELKMDAIVVNPSPDPSLRGRGDLR